MFKELFDSDALSKFTRTSCDPVILATMSYADPGSEPLASDAFLSHLKALYPTRGNSNEKADRNRWYIVAAVAYAASNRPEGVPLVLQYVLKDPQFEHTSAGDSGHEKRLRVVREIRDAIFKAGMTCGYAKVREGAPEPYAITRRRTES